MEQGTSADVDLNQLGFDQGLRGVHTSRTMMYDELSTVMNGVPRPRTQDTVRHAVLEENLCGKSTQSTRIETASKLISLYSFHSEARLFQAFDDLWDLTESSHPVLALLMACSRDTVLLSTATSICDTSLGEPFSKERVYQGLLNGFAAKYRESTLRSVSRNIMASWKQSGHIAGRQNAIRTKAPSDYIAAAFAVVICLLRGMKGQEVLDSLWVRLLDLSAAELEAALQEASRHGLLTYRRVASVIELAEGPYFQEEARHRGARV
jgi:hypothetical protein